MIEWNPIRYLLQWDMTGDESDCALTSNYYSRGPNAAANTLLK